VRHHRCVVKQCEISQLTTMSIVYITLLSK